VPRWRRLIYVLPTGFLIAYIGLLPRVVRLTAHARSDFIAWWSASAIVLSGSPVDVYDSARLWSMEKRVAGPKIGYTGMPYPPIYLMLIAPLAHLPYVWALALWSALSLGAYALVMAAIDRRGLLLALTFPGAYLNLVSGQTGFLTLVLLGAGVLCLNRWPIVAGAFFGACAYKPQLAVLIPVFLVATGRWRTLFASAASLALLCLLSCAVFGWRIWIAFFRTVQLFRVSVIEQGNPGWEKFQSVFGAARLWGLGVESSYLVHFSIAALAVAVAVLIWRRADAIELQGAALVAATMLVTPYLLHYDTVLLALPIAWLAVDGLRSRFLPGDVFILVVLWLYPFLTISLARHGLSLTPIVIAAALLVCARRSLGLIPAHALSTSPASP
jgi:alpha-1,2-mannosyltransferase